MAHERRTEALATWTWKKVAGRKKCEAQDDIKHAHAWAITEC